MAVRAQKRWNALKHSHYEFLPNVLSTEKPRPSSRKSSQSQRHEPMGGAAKARKILLQKAAKETKTFLRMSLTWKLAYRRCLSLRAKSCGKSHSSESVRGS